MEEALIAYLLADATVSSVTGGRVYWVRRPQGSAIPAVILTRVSGVRNYTQGGPSSIIDSRVQVDCYAESYSGVKAVARAVIARLSGAQFTQGGIQFQGAFIDGERDTFEADVTPPLHRSSVDVVLAHTE